jgi:MoaA/NifB/PqqE/SkfB family radical SAM enzyme
MDTIRQLAPHQQRLNLRLGVNQTIVDAEGVEHYQRLRQMLRPFGIHNNVVMAYDASATYNLEREVDIAPHEVGHFSTFGSFTDQDLERLLGEVEGDLGALPWFERVAKRYYLRGVRNRLLRREGTPNPKCVALNSHLRIFPNGDVPTCQFNSSTVGNLRRQTFREVWESTRTADQRRWVHQCPGCWAECELLPNAIYTLDILRAGLPLFGTRRREAGRSPRPLQPEENPEAATG